MDMWCDLCGDKVKSASVKINGDFYEVCNYCKNLTVEDKN